MEASDLSSSASLGNASPDFQVMSGDGEIADVIVEGSDQKAERTAADVQGAKASFGAGQAVVVKETERGHRLRARAPCGVPRAGRNLRRLSRWGQPSALVLRDALELLAEGASTSSAMVIW